MTSNEKAVIAQQEQQQDRIDSPDEEESDLPPAYSMPSPSTEATSRPQTFGRTIPGLPTNLDFTLYAPLSSKVSPDLSTTTIVDPTLCQSPQALVKFLQEQISIPPVPEIRLNGVHKEWNGDEVDFDIRLNLMRYFLPREGDQGLGYTKLVSSGSGSKSKLKLPGGHNATAANTGIEQWAQAFCADPATDKSFIISRKLTNWDSEYLIGRLHGLLQTVNYKGRTSINFPLYHTRTILRSTPSSFGNTLRSAFVGSEKYEVEVFWPYASHMPGDDSDDGEQDGSSVRRKCIVRSENGWFRDWRPVLRAAVLGKKKGWLGLEDWIEVAMTPPMAETAPAAWGQSR